MLGGSSGRQSHKQESRKLMDDVARMEAMEYGKDLIRVSKESMESAGDMGDETTLIASQMVTVYYYDAIAGIVDHVDVLASDL